MKKTIAILLILVIGMVGVFANPVKLNLETTIDLVNRLAITNAGTAGHTFGTGSTAETAVSVNFDPATAYVKGFAMASGEPTATAANLHFKTNNPNAVEVTFSASLLINQSNSNLVIPYKLQIGAAVAKVQPTVTIDPVTEEPVTSYEDIDGESAIYSVDNTTSMVEMHVPIKLAIPGDKDNFADNYAAGTYSATVTFTLTAS